MTLAGGPAAKLGNRYETLWTVSECIRLLRGDSDSIRIEEPGEDKAEFVVRTGRQREFHQVKRSHPSGKWSLATLASDRLLHEIGSQVAGENDRFVFVSGSDARELVDLCKAANDAESAEEFAGKFLKSSKEREKSFNGLLGKWQCGSQTAIDRLRRISVHTIDEHELEKKVLWGLQALFLDQPRKLLDTTRALVEDSVHRTLHRTEIIEHIRKRGHWLRRLQNPENAGLAIQEVTAHYLGAARRRLIQETLVPREAKVTLLSRLADTATDSVVLGKAGTGKTAYIVGITEALRSRGWPVLTFRLDRVDFANPPTTAHLGQSLNLEESPALVLAAAAEAVGCPSVLIVDQLDAVGSASGRSTAAFEMVEALLHEARGQRPRVVIHTVVVCRSFDWQHDHRLRRLLPRDSSEPVKIAEFEVGQVKEILVDADFDVTLFSNRQLELLRLPQNLALFLEAEFEHSYDFKTTKDLFDRYWDVKRQLVAERAAPTPDHWMDVIKTLSDKMTSTQQLSVPKESLDRFPYGYVMASEGVIVTDGHRYGFGHESFFDYCFARLFSQRGDHLVEFLKQSEQHLFHRAQVRQVLTYLRDADPRRYISELRALLADEGVRTHIKDLAITLLAAVTEPTDAEWEVQAQLFGPTLDAMAGGTASPDKLSAVAWRRFTWSQSWFDITCERGLVKEWLASGNDTLANVAVNYVSWHARHSPEQAVALLEPYASCGDKWRQRLRPMANAHHTSRRIFEFSLQLIDNGTFDGVPESVTEMFYRLHDNHSDWFAEALAHWMRRRLAVSQRRGERLTEKALLSDHAAAEIAKVAEAVPAAFIDHILPVVLDISDSCAVGDTPPKRDTVWGCLFKTDHPSGVDACLLWLADALATTARESIADLRDAISTLRERDTHVANHLLLALYRGAAAQTADEAVCLLCEQPWRFKCGFSDSPYWCGRETIRALVPHCSAESRKRLEDMVLEYVSPYERTKDGFRRIGWSRFGLLSAFPAELRSSEANAHFKELERKFGEPEGEPVGIRGGIVGSPIGEDGVNRMTDEQWLRAIDKHEEDRLSRIDVFKGGAYQLAQALERRVKEEPERFAWLSLKFPAEANAEYLAHTLSALQESDVSTALKLQVCRKAFDEASDRCGSAIADVIGKIKGPLPDQAVQMIHRLAIESKDPSEELWRQPANGGTPYYGDDMLSHGLNTTRGRAALAVRGLILTDAAHIDRFRLTLERMVCDKSPAVLCWVAGTLNTVTYFDAKLGISLFHSMDLSEDRLLATRHMDYFLRMRLRDGLVEVRSIIERMLRSSVADVCQAGARLAGLSVLEGNEAEYLVDEALRGSSCHRLGLAQVAATNIATPACRAWCEALLPTLLNDGDGDVRRKAASCFRQLEGTALETYEDLIRTFGESRAFREFSYDLLHALEKSLEKLPGLTCEICAKLAVRADTERPGLDTHAIVKLAFRVYQQHQDDEWTSNALDLIDLLCLNGSHGVEQELDDFER